MEVDKLRNKLRILTEQTRVVLHCPPALAPLWENLAVDDGSRPDAEPYDFVLVFVKSQAELAQVLPRLKNLGKADCLFWVAYPKKSGAIQSDLHRDWFWTALDSLNLRPVTQIALDDTWSALRFRPSDAVGKETRK